MRQFLPMPGFKNNYFIDFLFTALKNEKLDGLKFRKGMVLSVTYLIKYSHSSFLMHHATLCLLCVCNLSKNTQYCLLLPTLSDVIS